MGSIVNEAGSESSGRQTELAESADPVFHQLFEQQARLHPDAIAVIQQELTCSYAELNIRADELASGLRARGAGPECVVGVLLPRSVEILVALLGIAKAGAAFLLLDPATTPPGRCQEMLLGVSSQLVVSRSDLHLTGLEGTDVVWVDRPLQRGNASSLRREHLSSSPSGLAYVMYTSGSTGRPKGVAVDHAALSNYLIWARAAYLVPGGRGAPVFTSVAFDLTLTSLLVPLTGGQPVVLAPDDADFDEISQLLRRYRKFSFIKATPTHFSLIGSILRADVADVADRFVAGGERLRASAIENWRRLNPDAILFNEYGPTEGTIANVVWPVAAGDEIPEQTPIGTPIRCTDAQILDHELRPATGVGELYISGTCLARGYVRDPVRTAEAFRPNPFGSGDRIYRTGDLAFRNSDGLLVCLGRIDHQIKLNGHRIEPEEVEAVLRAHAVVEDGAVSLQIGLDGRERLVAFAILGQKEIAPSTQEMRAFLARHLPIYMIPSAIHWVQALPLSPAGKLDRAALARLYSEDSAAAHTAGRGSRCAE